jgi:tetratricopeptide (TPR) repeat protein
MACAARYGALLLLAARPALAAPALNGSFSGDLGVLSFETEQGGRVSGHFQGGGPCSFVVDRRILDGQFEGDVLLGTVILCQVGAACRERAYPFMAFYNAKEGTLSANIKLEASCDSPALKGKRLFLRKGTPEEAEGTPGTDLTSRRPRDSKRIAELARKAFDTGQKFLKVGDFSQASKQFELGLSYDERNFAGYLGLGVAEIGLGHAQRALDSYARSAELKPDFPDTYFNIACVYARSRDREQTLKNLEKAIRFGFDEPDLMNGDHDLKSLLGDAPEFRAIVAKASEQRSRRQHGARRTEGKR